MADNLTPGKSVSALRTQALKPPAVRKYTVRDRRSGRRVLGYVMLTGRLWQWSADGKTYTEKSTTGAYRVIPYRRPEYVLFRCSADDP